jgi:hypothetical protein
MEGAINLDFDAGMEERCLRNLLRRGLSVFGTSERAAVLDLRDPLEPLRKTVLETCLAIAAYKRIIPAAGKPKWKSRLKLTLTAQTDAKEESTNVQMRYWEKSDSRRCT